MKPIRLTHRIHRHLLTYEGAILKRSIRPGAKWAVVYALTDPYQWIQWRLNETASGFAMVGP